MLSLAKSRRILKQAIHLYKKKGTSLPETTRKHFESDLHRLDLAIHEKDKVEAATLAKKVSSFTKTHFPKKGWDHFKELIYALLFALIFAFLIRTIWFELYEVPTGSMRPTVEELDRLLVSKTSFGVHFPFRDKLAFFDPKYVKRNELIVFTVKGMPVSDSDMYYFYLFPGKKQFIKRALGKGGDTIYFYGGRIYGIDDEGKPLEELYDEEQLKKIGIEKITHIPYITFEGKERYSDFSPEGIYKTTTLYQMNQPVGELTFKGDRSVEGRFFDGNQWRYDQPAALKAPHSTPLSYSDLWGIGNFAVARLLTYEEVKNLYHTLPQEEAPLYLELKHTPYLTGGKFKRDIGGEVAPTLSLMTAFIPLQHSELEKLQNNLYTARFCIKQGRAYRYNERQSIQFSPQFEGVPDGCYEFYYGKGYKILPGGFLMKLPKDHPLYNPSPENIQKLFNLGIVMNTLFRPLAADQPFLPQRFAYFRDGDLYVMDTLLFTKESPQLQAFVSHELAKQNKENGLYVAFIDRGPPLKNGELDVDFIKAFGLKIPDGTVLALGDNYAMSADSRDFGFVPMETNLRGSPVITFWPPGKRIGTLPQVGRSLFTFPNLFVNALALLVIFAFYLYYKKRNQYPLFKE